MTQCVKLTNLQFKGYFGLYHVIHLIHLADSSVCFYCLYPAAFHLFKPAGFVGQTGASVSIFRPQLHQLSSPERTSLGSTP